MNTTFGSLTGCSRTLTVDGTTYQRDYMETMVPSMVRLPGRYRRYASQDEETARPNVSGQRQTVRWTFPDTIPDRDETPVLDDVDSPGQHTEPPRTVDHTGRPVTRQSDRPYLIWWLMMQNPSKEMIAELQPHDRDDIKQDFALKYWRQAVKQEANGKRITNPARHIAKEVSAWIGRNVETAQGDPLTQQQREDAVDALDAQRKSSEESRLQKQEAELKIEQGRFLAALTAKRDAVKPESLYCFKW